MIRIPSLAPILPRVFSTSPVFISLLYHLRAGPDLKSLPAEPFHPDLDPNSAPHPSVRTLRNSFSTFFQLAVERAGKIE